MRLVVTGAAGFIGSRVCGALLEELHTVLGLDSFTDNYPRAVKERNIRGLLTSENFRFLEEDLNLASLLPLFESADQVIHTAALPGVRGSYGDLFESYLRNNVLATQRALEAAREAGVGRFVYLSSSSVYGNTNELPTPESAHLSPSSPYGATKLAAEHLCSVYGGGSPGVTTLRLFTVYGPGQRPDMALSRLIRAGLRDSLFEGFGDGSQTRDFTYIDDAVRGVLLALNGPTGTYNIGSGVRHSLSETARMVSDALAKEVNVKWGRRAAGDVKHTLADISLARRRLGFRPQVDLAGGIVRQAAWLREQMG